MTLETTIQSPVPIVQEKIGKFKASRIIVKESWGILKQSKGLMWLPVLSTVLSLLVLAGFFAIYYFTGLGGDITEWKGVDQGGTDALGYGIFFVYYLATIFIANFFQASIFSIVNARFNGLELSVKEGLNKSVQNIGKIFTWSLITATVGVVLRVIADKSKLIGKIVAGLLGAAWNILTYFSLPSLIIGQTTVKDSFKESAAIIRKTWGETIIINFGVGLFFGLIVFAGIALGILVIIFAPFISVAIAVGVILFLFVLFITILSSTLGSIFKLALYVYARTGIVPQGFSPIVVQGAVGVK